MRKTLMLIYAVCAMIIISGSLLWFVFMLRADSLTGKIDSMNVFKTFTRQASEIIRNARYDENIDIHPILEQLCRNNSTVIPAVVIRSGGQSVFIWPENTQYFSLESTGGMSQEALPLFCMRAQTTIPATAYSESVAVHSVLQTVPVSTLRNRGQTVFFVVLTVTLFTLVLLIFSYLDFSSHDEESEYLDPFCGDDEDAAQHSGDTVDTELEIPRLSVEEETKESTAAPESSAHSLTEQIESLNRLHICTDGSSDDVPAEPTDNGTAAEAQQYPEETAAAADTIPTGVQNSTPDTFCPADNSTPAHLCYTPEPDNTPVREAAVYAENTVPQMNEQASLQAEEYGAFENSLKPRYSGKHNESAYGETQQQELQSADHDHLELNCNTAMPTGFYAKMIEDLQAAIRETAVAEEDLTLLFISMPDIMHNESIVQSVRTGLDRINKFFFFDEDTIGLILYYTTLDNAMPIAVKLYEDITSLLLFSDSNLPLGIGITTRAGRLIPAHRMVEEAIAAIRKTAEPDSDPIVAFRVNAEKYRRCLAQITENTAK